MKIRPLIIIAIIGIMIGITSAIIYNLRVPTQPPVAVSYNPYTAGIYATGIVESFQVNGSNINIYPEVSGRVTQIYLKNAQQVTKGTPILTLDDSVQKAVVIRDQAQILYAIASYTELKKQFEKTKKSYSLNTKSVSLNSLDNALYSMEVANENIKMAKAQYESDKALLDKYTIRSPVDGTVLRIVPTVGDYASPMGSYDPYSQEMLPTVQLGIISPYLQVRAYVDEILTPRLPKPSQLQATLFVRGLNNYSIPLEFESIQPYTIPNIELSDERNERVDVRVLPIIFKFKIPTDINIFPGQLVDVYIKAKS